MTEFDREQAIGLARQQLRNVLTNDRPANEAVEKYRAFLRHDGHGYLSAGRLLDLQRKSEIHELDRSDHDEIVLYGAAFLREAIQPPPWLATYIAQMLEGKRVRPAGSGGRKRTEGKRQQDFAVWMAVEALRSVYGLQRYSNSHAELEAADTAAALVAEAAEREGLDVGSTSYSAITKMLSDKFTELEV